MRSNHLCGRGWLVAGMTALLALAATGCGLGAKMGLTKQKKEPFILGADISWVPQEEAKGVKYSDHGVPKDVLAILKEHGFNTVRLRIFNDPKAPGGYSPQGFCGLDSTLAMARRVKAAGMGLLLDFHYSDNWADPAKQRKPAAWKDLDFAHLTQAVHDYTKDVMARLKAQGTAPDMVQIGNEITPGMLFPDGKSSDWDKLAALLKAGIAGAKEAAPDCRIVLHIDKGGDNEKTRWWVDNALRRGVQFDVLGESCYTRWHGQPEGWKKNFEDLVVRYPRLKFIIAEYSTKKREANDIIFHLPAGRGLGTFIWEPTRWDEAVFTRAGATNDLIDLYPQLAKDYGIAR